MAMMAMTEGRKRIGMIENRVVSVAVLVVFLVVFGDLGVAFSFPMKGIFQKANEGHQDDLRCRVWFR